MSKLTWTAAAGSLLAAGGLGLLLAGCATQGELGPRHAPSGLETPLPSRDFAAYVEQAKGQIAAANRAIGKPLDPEVIDDRAPFELVPDANRCPRARDGRYARAVLLIHGLGDTPFTMRDLGERFAAACYLVRAILLPGHGTVPGDLLEVDYRQWIEAVRLGVASFAGRAERLYLIGFGAGGTLALNYAEGEQAPSGLELGGLVLLAPALAPRNGVIARGYLALAELVPEDRFVQLLPDADPVRYSSIARNAELQLNELIGATNDRLGLLGLPVFMALSADDTTIDPEAARRWFCRGLIGPRRLLWYQPGGGRVSDCRLVEVRASDRPPEILDLAHPALPIAPDDRRYGATAGYFDCAHYYWETRTPKWLLCVDRTKTPANSAIRYGEITEQNLATYIVRRLTYNPDFEALVRAILEFIDRLPSSKPPLPSLKPAG